MLHHQPAWTKDVKEPLLPVAAPATEPVPSSSPYSRSRRSLLVLPILLSLLTLSFYLRHVGFLAQAPHAPPHFPTTTSVPASGLSTSVLDTALSASDFTPSDLPCRAIDEERYASLRGNSKERTLLAINLFNSENVLPTLARAVLEVAQFLGESNVHVSIFENGSDDRTVELLGVFKSVMDHRGIESTVLSDSTKTDWKTVDRIAQLAIYRNIIVAPASSPSSKFTSVLFFNDVFVCASDALELLYQRKIQDATATCGLDWVEKRNKRTMGGSAVFYDNWVTRSLTGKTLRPQYDIARAWRDNVKQLFSEPGEEYFKERFELGLPVPVYSCWNGMFAVDARPFRGEAKNGLREKPLQFRSGDVDQDECTASECKLIAKDLWKRGFNRFLIIPTVRLTYTRKLYTSKQLESLAARRFLPTYPSQRELIPWNEMPAPKTIECWAYLRRLKWDFWWLARWEKA